jgi:L-fuculose-phosphate aldolase
VIILANHGTVSYGESVERAYWWTEILDAYCRILLLAKDLGKVNYFTEGETRELLALKQKWGFKDPRLEQMENCDICANDIFRDSWQATGVERRAFEPPPAMPPASPVTHGVADQEALVKSITDRVLAALAAR